MGKFRSGIARVLALVFSVVLIVLLVGAVAAEDSETFLPLVGGSSASQPFAAPSEEPTPGPAVAVADVVAVELEDMGTPDNCLPFYSPVDDSYLCLFEGNETEAMEWWIATPAEGLKKHIQYEGLYAEGWSSPYVNAYDANHLVLTTREQPPLSPEPQPVYWIDINTGAEQLLGETVRGWLVDVNSAGYVTFLGQEAIHVVNPLLGTEAKVPLAFDAAVRPTPSLPEDITPEPEPTWPAWLLVTPEVTATVAPETAVPAEMATATPDSGWAGAYPYLYAYAKASPDGKKVALAQVVGLTYSTLLIVDISTGQRTMVTNELPATYTSATFSWSPDGSYLVYGVERVEHVEHPQEMTKAVELRLVSADGAESRLVWQDVWLMFRFARWLPGSDLILYGVDPGGYSEDKVSYRVINVNGGDTKEIMVGANPCGVDVSHDGHRIRRYLQVFDYTGVVEVTRSEFVVTALNY